MTTPITTFKKIMLDLDISGTSQYSVTNDLSNNNTCFLNFNLMTNITNQNVTITFQQYISQGGILENTETFTLNYKNNTLSRNINIITAYTLITITNNAFNGILSGFIEKLIIGDNISIDASGQTVAVRGGVDISGQRVDISGQRVDISGQNILMNAYYRTGATNSNLTSVQPSGTTTVKALETYSYTVGLNNALNIPLPITSTTGATTQSLDVQIQNPTTTNYNYETGLNVYNILPKIKQYTIGGIDNNATAYRLIGGNATTPGIDISGYSYGLANPRIYYATFVGAATNSIYIDYVDSSGNLIEDAGPYTVRDASFNALPNMISVNKFRLTTNNFDSGNSGLFISPVTNTNRSICCGNLANYGIGIFTVPNGYIGYISTLNADFSTTGALMIYKWSALGIRSVVYKVNITAATLNISITAHNEGSIGGIFYPGESIGFSHNFATTNKTVCANMILKAN